MWAIISKNTGNLMHEIDSGQYLIFKTKSKAWNFLLVKANVGNPEDYDVVAVQWTRK